MPDAFSLYEGKVQEIFSHSLALAQRNVLFQVARGALGDVLTWFPAVGRFQKHHVCQLTCSRFIELFATSYPQIRFITAEDQDDIVITRPIT